MQFLHYTSVPWPYLVEPFSAFPDPNQACDPDRANGALRDTLAHMIAAENAGFDWLGMGEEHMNAYGMVPNPTLLLTVVAAQTRRAKIAVLGNPLPLLNPVRVAEEYAMIDVLSGGRVTFSCSRRKASSSPGASGHRAGSSESGLLKTAVRMRRLSILLPLLQVSGFSSLCSRALTVP
ncbi:LLM class flavin-dependent oxidoreductase [Streptomyces phaeochromogenes]|uniref:LLM class flavin-dependent oxidoreductase n=1 Tax=Streptomyces phaeochromogenes TaxID=1923 RepID=UPI0033C32536